MKNVFESVGEKLNHLAEVATSNVGFLLLSVLVVVVLLASAYAAEVLIGKKTGTKGSMKGQKVRKMTIISMLAAISVVLMLFKFPLWFVPSFYTIDFSELPVIIGAFTLGPVAGIVIEFIKILLNLLINGTYTAFVGEFANFIIGCAFVIPASFVYYLKKSRKNAIIGLGIGTLIAAVAGGILNAYMLLPKYAEVMGTPISTFIDAGTEKNQLISGMSSFILLGVTPFNIFKYAMVSVITMIIYKKISYILKSK
ncbi:ECF transporter S component [Clostridium sp. Marseille-P299]|uniref:ECF transporter S component n=1 Tax=Clostridium sp. Marseille-P299 TaxID=1805477 RepID=UPI0009ED599F|nr:ECF transporter S component [Clostridium sp. Marseille-P299]